MKHWIILFAATLSFHLFALDQTARDLIEKIKEQMKEMPPPNYQLPFEEESPEKLEAWVIEAEKRTKENKWAEEEQKFVDLVKSAPKTDKFEGDEAEFRPELLANPSKELDITQATETPAFKETILETCRESGDYEREFKQTLQVTLLPEFQKVNQCCGHHEMKKVSVKGVKDKKKRKKIADKKADAFQKELENNPAIKKGFSIKLAKDVHDTHIDIIIDFAHIDNAAACDHSQITEVPGTKIEKETWIVDKPAEYASIKNNPNCKLSLTHVEDGPETRLIDGKEVFRELWARTLLFHCSPGANSPCAKYRELGGQLVKKQCIQKNEETEDCEIWEKTYDLGKAHSSQTTYTFANESKKIWGMNGELKPDPENNSGSSLSSVLGFIKTLSDMPLGEGKKLLDLDGNMPIFNGTAHTCNCHVVDELYDCCKDVTALWPAHCDDKELELHEMRDAGRCHRVGSYHNKTLGLKTSKTSVYCCYPTKLLRIFNEKARNQMGLKWGKPKEPNCSGFSLEEMEGKIDISSLDYSEAAEDLEVNEAGMAAEMTKKLRAALENPDLKNVFQEDPDASQ